MATALPGSIGLAASFDTDLARQAGAVVGNEAKLKGNDLVYAPTVNILRTPLWGRAFESLGEDPFLTSRMGVPYIRALQTPGGDRRRQALRRQQPGGPAGRQRDDRQPLHGRCRGRRADAARDLPARLRGRRQGRRRRLGDVLIQPAERAARLREPAAPERHPAPRLGVQGPGAGRLRGVEDGRRRARCGTRLRAVAVRRFRRRRELHAGRDRGWRSRPARSTGADIDRAVRHILRTLFASGFFDRAAYVPDERGDRQGRPPAHVPAARRARGGAAAEPRRRPAAHRPASSTRSR